MSTQRSINLDPSYIHTVLDRFQRTRRGEFVTSEDNIRSIFSDIPEPVTTERKYLFVTQQIYEDCKDRHPRYILYVLIEFLVLLSYLLMVVLILDVESVYVRYSMHHYVKSRFDTVSFEDTDFFEYKLEDLFNSTDSILRWYNAAIVDNDRITQYFEQKARFIIKPTQLVGRIIISKIQVEPGCNQSVTMNETSGKDSVLAIQTDDSDASVDYHICYPPYSTKVQTVLNTSSSYGEYTVCKHCDTNFKGYFATYKPQSHQVVLPNSTTKIKEQFKRFADTYWSSRAVRLLMMKVHFVNIPTRMFSVIKIGMETPATGSIFPKIFVRTGSIFIYKINHFKLLLSGLIFFWIILIAFEVIELIYFRWKYFLSLGQYLDLVILIAPCLSYSYFAYLAAFGRKAWQQYRANSKYSMDYAIYTTEVFSYYLVISWVAGFLRTFRYFCLWSSYIPFTAIISNMKKTVYPLLFLFFVITITLAMSAHLLLYQKSFSYSTILKSWFTIITFSIISREHYEYEFYWRETVIVIFYFIVVVILIQNFTKVFISFYIQEFYPYSESTEGETLNSLLFGFCSTKGAQCIRNVQRLYYGRDNNLCYEDIRYTLLRLGFNIREFRLFKSKYALNYENTIKGDYWPYVLYDLENTNLEMLPHLASHEEIIERNNNEERERKAITESTQITRQEYESLVHLVERTELISEIAGERCETLTKVLAEIFAKLRTLEESRREEGPRMDYGNAGDYDDEEFRYA